MISIKVDSKTCLGDGRCVDICPVGILKMNATEKVPEFIPGGGEICINCGHCLASCPPGAIQLSSMDMASIAAFDHARMPDAGQVELLLKGRRSIRIYKDKPVTREVLEKLLDIARYAPSGINRQPVSWSVIMGKERVHDFTGLVAGWMEELLLAKSPVAGALRFERLLDAWKKGEDRICRSAPSIVIAYGLKDDPMVSPSCTIAATYLELAAFGLGLGACWAGYANMAINMSEEVRKFAGLSSRASAGAVMMIGYSKFRFRRIPARNLARIIWK